MKSILFFLVTFISLSISGFAQFERLIVEEVKDNGSAPGKTYRIYAQLQQEGDQIYIVYGDSLHPLKIESTAAFFQSPFAGPLAKDSNKALAAQNDSIKYDSWLTIGASDNYNNNVMTLNLDVKAFEKTGAAIYTVKDGAWFCTPADKQAYAGKDRRVLLMQLTTTGDISGTLCLMGKTKAGESFQVCNLSFSTGGEKRN